jgi:tetratricopeptide (TPR) repeat protein
VISSKTNKTKPVLEPNHSLDVIPEIPNHSNTDSKHIGFGYKKSFIAAAALLSFATIIWIVGQQPTKQGTFDVAKTDKKTQTEAHAELKTIRDPEETSDLANIPPLDTTENPLNSTEIKVEKIVSSDVGTKRLEQPEQVIMPTITENETALETKTDSPHGQDIEYSNTDVTRANIATLLAKARTQEDSKRFTLPEGDNAVETFRYLLKIDPDNVDATQGIRRIKRIFIQQAERLKDQGQWQKAEIATAKALQLDPENSTLAILLAHIKQYTESSSKTTTHTATQITESPSSSNLLDHYERSANRNFITAAENGDNALLQVFLNANMPIDVKDDLTQNTALIAAAKEGHLKTITLILANNPNINWQNLNGQTALITAAENGHHRVVSHLLLHGANLHIKDNLGRDALMFAVEKNQVTTPSKNY